MMNYDEVNPSNINLQTRSCQYDKPSTLSSTKSKTKVSAEPLTKQNVPLHIPQPKVETIPRICNSAYNRASHTYNIVDDLAQSLAAMSMLEVLQSCPYQKKSLLTTLSVIDPSDDHLIVFLVDTSEHSPLPSSVAF